MDLHVDVVVDVHCELVWIDDIRRTVRETLVIQVLVVVLGFAPSSVRTRQGKVRIEVLVAHDPEEASERGDRCGLETTALGCPVGEEHVLGMV